MVFVVDKVALGQVFTKYFDFPCQFASTIIVAVPSGFSLTPREKYKKITCVVHLKTKPVNQTI
jgi:hypothetical protein